MTSHGTQIEKNSAVEPAFAHARDVDVAVLLALGDVEGLVEEQPLRRVVVRVDHDRAVVQLLGTGRDAVGLRGWVRTNDRQARTAAAAPRA